LGGEGGDGVIARNRQSAERGSKQPEDGRMKHDTQNIEKKKGEVSDKSVHSK